MRGDCKSIEELRGKGLNNLQYGYPAISNEGYLKKYP